MMSQNYAVLFILLLSVIGGIFGHFLKWNVVQIMFWVLATVLFVVAAQFMKESMKEEPNSKRFYLFYICSYCMLFGAFVTNNLFFFNVFAVLALLSMYPLILHRRGEMAVKSARIYIIFLIAAIVFLLTGMAVVYKAVGSLNYVDMAAYVGGLSGNANAAITAGGLLMFIGYAIFAGIFPLQFQVTRGSSHCMVEVSAILSCLMSKLGIFGMIVLCACLFSTNMLYGRILLVLGPLTTIWGLLITLSSTDIRKILMGINVVMNGFNTLSIGLMVLSGKLNGYAVRSSILVLVALSLSLFVLYMIALELVRKVHTYEINGLIASGKGNGRLIVAGFLACASLAGVPGLAGFLAHSMLFNTITKNIGWKWLTVVYVILWAFFMTAVVRIFMKLFISKKEETLRILTTDEELKQSAEREKTAKEQKELSEQKSKKGKQPYVVGEILLLGIGVIQIIIGIFPNQTFGKIENVIMAFLHGENVPGTIPYFAGDVFIGFGIAVLLCIVLYVNLVHGILLRAVRNKKNKKLQENL